MSSATECYTVLDKLHLVKFAYTDFRVEPILSAVLAASKKNGAYFKSGQNRLKNNHFDLLV